MLDLAAREKLGRIRPVYIIHEEGVSQSHLKAVTDAVNEILVIAAAPRPIGIKNFGAWRQPNFEVGEVLKDWQSVDWYIDYARRACKKAGQVDASTLLNLIYKEPWQENVCHYDLMILRSDLGHGNLNFCVGLASKSIGALVSILRFLKLEPALQFECIKTVTMHEIGHVFGLVPETRTVNVNESLGKHCTNRCIMRQGLSVPHDWINFTNDRLKYGAFCPTCQRDLQLFFRQ